MINNREADYVRARYLNFVDELYEKVSEEDLKEYQLLELSSYEIGIQDRFDLSVSTAEVEYQGDEVDWLVAFCIDVNELSWDIRWEIT